MLEIAKKTISSVVKTLFDIDFEPQVSVPEEQFGDVASNVAMQLAKDLDKNPREIAELIAKNLQLESFVSVASVAGPGFINITFEDSELFGFLDYDSEKSLEDQKILVEYSDPNPLKPLHAGHLYTTLVGDVIARLVEQAGAETVRLNYGGDVGLHVARSMWAIIKNLGGENPEKLEEVDVKERPTWLGDRYVEGSTAYEEDETAKAEIKTINKKVYLLHSEGNKKSSFAQIYWTCRGWSYEYFETLYDQLQVTDFDRFIPESEITPLGIQTVREQMKKDVYQKSDGAIVFKGEDHGLHTRVFINSEGLPTYEAKDVGLSLTKWQDYHFDKSIIITANEQKQYMQVVIKSIEQFAPEPAKRTKHLTHGVVKMAGGKKMSSRKGNVVTALDIIESARAAGVESGTADNDEIVLAAIKFAFLKSAIGGDIVYDPDESVAMEGKSGPYLQYAHARACSILRKADGERNATEETSNESIVLEKGERTLVRKLAEHQIAVSLATEELAPHHICTYLYELAQEFNRFYENNKVIGHDRQIFRLKLVNKYAKTLSDGLELLGIVATQKM